MLRQIKCYTDADRRSGSGKVPEGGQGCKDCIEKHSTYPVCLEINAQSVSALFKIMNEKLP